MASWPPSLLPIAQGDPTSSGVGVERVVGALAVHLADRVDRRQVDDVEAHRRDRLEPLGGGAEGAADDLAGLLVDVGALGAREELVPAREQRALAVDEERVGALDGEQVAQRVGGEDAAPSRRTRRPRAAPRPGASVSLSALIASLTMRLLGRGRGRPPATRSSSSTPSVNISSTSTPARILMPASCSQVPIGSLHAWTSKVQAPSVSGAHRRRHPGDLALDVVHPHRWPAYAARVGEHDLGAELVVTLAEHQRGDVEGLADGRLRGVAPEVDDGCHVHDGDASDHAPQTCEVRPFTQTGRPAADAGLAKPLTRVRGGPRQPPSEDLELGGAHRQVGVGAGLAVGVVDRVVVLLTGVRRSAGALVLQRHQPDRGGVVSGTSNERRVRFGATGAGRRPGRRRPGWCRSASRSPWRLTQPVVHTSSANRRSAVNREPESGSSSASASSGRPSVGPGGAGRSIARDPDRLILRAAAPARSTATNGLVGVDGVGLVDAGPVGGLGVVDQGRGVEAAGAGAEDRGAVLRRGQVRRQRRRSWSPSGPRSP